MTLPKAIARGVAVSAVLLTLIVLSGCCTRCAEPRQSVKLMTYNIHHGEGEDGALDLERIADVIAAADADVIALQEVDNNFSPRSNFADQARYLAEALNMQYAYGPALQNGPADKPGLYGNAILSRYPLSKTKNHLLTRFDGFEQRAALQATVKLPDDNYTVISTHLDHKSAQLRDAQAKDLMALLGERPQRIIVMGDFNCPPPGAGIDHQSPNAVARVLEKLASSCAVIGKPAEATIGGNSKIDYIFISPDLADDLMDCGPVSNDVTAKASDHLPVAVELRLY